MIISIISKTIVFILFKCFTVKVLFGREVSGSVDKRYLLPISKFSNVEFHGRVLGHLTAVYCVCFDTTGRYIATVGY